MTKEKMNEFKRVLEERLKKVEEDIETLQNELEEVATFENIEDIEDLAQLETINDSDKALLQRLMEEKEAILKALRRIKEGTYGKCKDGTKIALEKLQADPLYEC